MWKVVDIKQGYQIVSESDPSTAFASFPISFNLDNETPFLDTLEAAFETLEALDPADGIALTDKYPLHA